MKRMRIILMSCICMFLVVSTAQADMNGDELWQKALSIMEANQGWVAKDIYSYTEELNRKGVPVNTLGIFMESEIGSNGELTTKVVKIEENSEDITDKRKDDLVKMNQETMSSEGFQFNPYSEALKQNKNVIRKNDSKTIEGKECVGYEFEIKKNKNDILCIAWVEKETGIPMQIEYNPKNSLKMFGKFENVSTYNFSAENWYMTNSLIRVEISLLIIKKILRMSMTFSNYIRM